MNRGPLSSSRLSALPFFFWGPTPPLLVAVWMVEDESRGCWLEADRSGICRRRCVGLLLVGYSGRPVCGSGITSLSPAVERLRERELDLSAEEESLSVRG